MHWLYLSLAIIFEVGGTTCMKLSEGLTKPLFAALIFVLYGVSFVMLALALKKIDLGLSYAIWAGIGTAAIALIGYVWFKERWARSRSPPSPSSSSAWSGSTWPPARASDGSLTAAGGRSGAEHRVELVRNARSTSSIVAPTPSAASEVTPCSRMPQATMPR